MERYHIFKLGLAILFYAAYCIRPMMVSCQETDNIIEHNHRNKTDTPVIDNYWVYIQGVDGKPGVDFPVYSYIPRTTFSCRDIESGYYADMDTDCQVFHICEEGKKISFLCPNGTIFHQSELICEWWNKVNCSNSLNLYEESAERLQNDIAQRKVSRRVNLTGTEIKHGAVMRIEEESSVRATQNGKSFAVSRNNKIKDQRNSKKHNQAAKSNQQNNNNFEINISKTEPILTSPKRDNEASTENFNNIESPKHTQKLSINSNYFTPTDSNKEYHVQFSSSSSTSKQRSVTKQEYSSVTQSNIIRSNDNQYNTNRQNTIRTTAPTPKNRGSIKYNSNYQEPKPTEIPKPDHPLEIIQAKEYPLGFPQHKTIENKVPLNHKTLSEVHQNDLDESQVPQETASFVKNKFNSISDSDERKFTTPGGTYYSNHRTTYSELKQPSYTTSKLSTSISSITPHLVTTQPINNGKPFVGSRIGNNYVRSTTENPNILLGVVRHSTTNTYSSNHDFNPFGPFSTTTEKYLPSTPVPTRLFNVDSTDSPLLVNQDNIDGTVSTNSVPSDSTDQQYIQNQFNLGSTSKTLPPISTTITVTNSLPTQIFNVGSTDQTIEPKIIATYSTTKKPDLAVPQEGSLNLGQLGSTSSTGTTRKPVSEPPFVKKFVAPLYSTPQPLPSSTKSYVDHATVYGTFAKSTTAKPTNNYFGNGVSVRFNADSDRVGIQLSKSVGGGTASTANTKKPILLSKIYKGNENQLRFGSTVQPPFLDINSNVHISDIVPEGVVPATPLPKPSGFFVTKNFAPQGGTFKSDLQKPRPFQKSYDIEPRFENSKSSTVQGTVPPYQISSARSFGLSESPSPAYSPTVPTVSTTPTTPTKPTSSVYENIDNMLQVLMEIANVNRPDNGDYSSETARPGLIIPPSVGPQTLHSLAQYFANSAEANGTQELESIDPEMKEKLTTLLTQMTIHGYNNLFINDNSDPSSVTYIASTAAPTISSKLSEFSTRRSTADQFDSNNESHPTESHVKNDASDAVVSTESTLSIDAKNDLDEEQTTSAGLRQLARNFSIALSSYLNDPVTFKKELEGLRPTEPPLLHERLGGTDDQGSNDDELLNFSDADIRTSLPPVYSTSSNSKYASTTPSPKPTWGNIIASNPLGQPQDTLTHNSLGNPDLHTADSQSFVPKYNNVNVYEGFGSKIPQSFQVKSRLDNQKQKSSSTELPLDHWTSSPEATQLWRNTFNVNPAVVNGHFETSTVPITPENEEKNDEAFEDGAIVVEDESPKVSSEPQTEIKYELRSLPPLSLNSTQVHGILIDFMNSTKSDDTNRLQRILRKLNTTEDEFLTRMKTIEENPLTKRLILLLISECGANITKDLGLSNLAQRSVESLDSASNGRVFEVPAQQTVGANDSSKQGVRSLVNPNLRETAQDARALQLLNSLYSIASRFGRK